MVDYNAPDDIGDGGAAAILASLCVLALVLVGVFFYLNLDSQSRNVVPIDTLSRAADTTH
ncbi:MAG: hypothetical protein ABI398_03175 [Devosia sp.]